MVYSTFMAAVFGMLFAYLIIVENSWLSVIPWILYIIMIGIGQHFEDKMNERIKRLEEETEEVMKEKK